MTIHILEDNKTLFKYSIDDLKFTHYNTTNEDGTTNDGRQLSEEEKKNKIKESLKYIENLKTIENKTKNILDEDLRKKSEELKKSYYTARNAAIKKYKKQNELNKKVIDYLNSKSDTESD
jgi:hypothetical protein